MITTGIGVEALYNGSNNSIRPCAPLYIKLLCPCPPLHEVLPYSNFTKHSVHIINK